MLSSLDSLTPVVEVNLLHDLTLEITDVLCLGVKTFVVHGQDVTMWSTADERIGDLLEVLIPHVVVLFPDIVIKGTARKCNNP